MINEHNQQLPACRDRVCFIFFIKQKHVFLKQLFIVENNNWLGTEFETECINYDDARRVHANKYIPVRTV